MKKELGYLVLGGVIASVLTGSFVYAQTSANTSAEAKTFAPCHQERGGEGIFGKMDKDQMLKNQAEMLGMTQAELQTALDSGQRFDQIAESKGITQDQIHEKMQAQMKDHLSELVAAGTITQAQMDEHLERMANRPDGKGFGPHGPRFDTQK